MKLHSGRILILALFIGFMAISAAPAHAAGTPVQSVLVHQGTVSTSSITPFSVNGLLDADMAIYVAHGSAFTSLAAEGHLLLTPSGGGYTGTFVDDLGGARIFPASGTGISPSTLNGNYVVDTANGRFTFSIGGTFVSTVPAKYGPGAVVGTILYGTHSYTLHAPLAFTLGSFTIGVFMPPASGALTLTTDALGYIVPFNSRLNVNSNFTYTLYGVLHSYPITYFGRYYPADGAGDGSLTIVLRVGFITFNIIDAREDTGGQRIISGDALGQFGPSAIQASFTAH